MDLLALIFAFARNMVALSGAHTIGQARCTLFRDRVYNENNIDQDYAAGIRVGCPVSVGDNLETPIDISSPTDFNNGYFTNLMIQRGLLHSDQQLFNGGSTDALVAAYTANNTLFFTNFAAAMLTMSELSPLTGTDGQIRTDCRRINSV